MTFHDELRRVAPMTEEEMEKDLGDWIEDWLARMDEAAAAALENQRIAQALSDDEIAAQDEEYRRRERLGA